MVMAGTHDWTLVVVSIAIAIVASYTALDLAGRTRASEGWLRSIWLGAAAAAMGGGIWSMHFVAMLAFSVPGMEFTYDPGLTLLSLIVAIGATGTSFVVTNRLGRAPFPLLASGLLMGLGVVAMHYIGMAAMHMGGTLSYDRLWLSISVLIAIGAATTALWIGSRDRHPVTALTAAVLMGFAIAGMHYAGMRAAVFTMAPGLDMAKGVAGRSQTDLAFAVSATTFIILSFALIAATFDRRFALLAAREAEALRASEERFRSLYRGTPLPLHSLDHEGRIEQVSNIWLELMGYAREEVTGRSLASFLTEASARQLRQKDWPELIERGILGPHEYRAVTKDGRFLDVMAAAKVERDGEGNFLRVLGGLTDITERKRAEDALRQTQKIEAIGQLTGGVAHDFNNLLAVIVGNLELLRKRVPDDPQISRLVESAFEGAQRGASLTQRLLAFARRQDLKPRPVDVADLVRGMADLLRRSLGPQIRVETRFPLDLPRARVDAHQLEMALLNLAVNARDAMPGGGTLDISAADVSVADGDIRDLRPGHYVRLALEDGGEGMDEETLRRAVDPFFTTKGVGKGTGLGLSMIQGLAAQSGGHLALRSVVGVGTVAELYLPVADGAEEPERRSPEGIGAEIIGPRRSILVVDDDPLVLANTIAMLEELGHRTYAAVSAEDALYQIERSCGFDLVMTDQLMPGMTGLELIKRVRQLQPELPTLLMTGFADLEDEERERVPTLRKPFDLKQLAKGIRDTAATGSPSVIPLRRRTGK
ncbi:MAG: PAS domain S-box protein [Sphingomonas sp.]|nr:MHYT domain-containing protein [Sphingomonas sp.]MBO9622307.1 PAS domain S-box protein [Sphingomonas sp.]